MTVRTDHDARGVTTITIDREAKLNALDSPTLEALAEVAASSGARPGLRAVVLRGAGARAFIGGADVVEMSGLSGPEAARAFITRVHHACDALRRMPVPVIARVHRDDAEAPAEIFDLWLHGGDARAIGVNHQQRLARAINLIVELDAIVDKRFPNATVGTVRRGLGNKGGDREEQEE